MPYKTKTIRRSIKERDILILDHLYMVKKIVDNMWKQSEFFRQQLDFDDAIQLGNIALIRAAELYDETRGTKFSTYAWTCIRLFLMRKCREEGNLITTPYRNRTFVSTVQLNKFIEPISCYKTECRHDQKMMLKSLSKRQVKIICWRYGLLGKPILRLHEISAKIGCTRQRVSQIEHQALEQIKSKMKDEFDK